MLSELHRNNVVCHREAKNGVHLSKNGLTYSFVTTQQPALKSFGIQSILEA